MLLEKPVSPWIRVGLFGVVVALVPLTDRPWHRPSPLPHTMTELGTRLSRCAPSLHVIPQFSERPESSIWICTQPRSREQLWGLMRDPQRVKTGPWRGIVFCERMGEGWVMEAEDEFIHLVWGEYGMRVGRFVFFGDPNVLQRIREVIFDCEARGKNSKILPD